MINYDEELKKFKPSLDIDQVEDAIYGNDIKDVTDIVQELLKETKSRMQV